MTLSSPQLDLSGGRFAASYRLAASPAAAEALAREIAVEQTVEFPASCLPAGDLPDRVVGRIEAFQHDGEAATVRISYADELAAGELTQLLNIVHGNVGFIPGVRLLELHPSPGLLAAFRGPRHGVAGLRERLGAPVRPLIATAAKPLGLGPAELARLAELYARAGIDLIKDDHGITNQPFSPFEERVARLVEAVARGNQASGGRALYAVNVTAPGEQLLERAERARDLGADALLVSPGLVSLDGMRRLADAELGLPLISHPTWIAHLTYGGDRGISHKALLGQLVRLAGADATIFLNYGGRFPDTEADCRGLAEGCSEPFGELAPILPVAGGGVTLARIEELVSFYGPQVMLLIGGGLHVGAAGEGELLARCVAFREAVEVCAASELAPSARSLV